MIVRAAKRLLQDAASDTPVVLVQGPRQAGKSTLVQGFASDGQLPEPITLDDPLILAEAKSNPLGFLRQQRVPMILDEVQRAPELLLSIKLIVDKDRKPGQFILTGSANVLTLPKVADSLAGRMEVLELLPLAQSEIEGAEGNFVDRLFLDTAPPKPQVTSTLKLSERLARGGFPEPSQRGQPERREAWFRSYVRTVLDRDVRDLANISGLSNLPRLLNLLAARSGQTLNISSLGVETGIPHTTLTRYIDLLKALYLIQLIPAWSFDVDARLIRAPKAYMIDTGLLCYLCGMDSRALGDKAKAQPVLETLVANELTKLCQTSRERPNLFHLRTVRQKEVSFVLESRDGRVVGVEVVPDKAVTPQHLQGLRYLSELAEDRFFGGAVLYDGADTLNLGGGIWALPISALWS